MKKEVGKFLLDVAKLLIGGVLLTGIMRHDIPLVVLFSVGGVVTATVIIIAFALIWNSNKQNKK
ncbi:MAG: hypothetical protein LBT61_00590 [Prevotellaceae bacterium]|jgi:uncharacterized protein (DUF697 family)|nr:hypothetical protein [Prevotellaceae bacterium]